MTFKTLTTTLLLSTSFLLFTACNSKTTQEEVNATTVQNPTTTETTVDTSVDTDTSTDDDNTVTGTETTGGGDSADTTPQTQADTTPPVLTLNGKSNVTLEQGTVYTELGATATDAVDGTVSVSIGGSVDTSIEGTYNMTYSAKDKAGNEASVSREVVVGSEYKILITSQKGNTAGYRYYASFNIALSHKPTYPVEIYIESDNPDEGIVIKRERDGWDMKSGRIVIQPEDWEYGKQIDIKGTNKNVINGKQDYHIVTSPAVSDDPHFNGLDVEDVWMRGEILKIEQPIDDLLFFPELYKNIELNINYNGGSTRDLKYTLIDKPSGMKIIKFYPNFITLDWIPENEDVGKTYTVILKVSSDILSHKIKFDVKVGQSYPLKTVVNDSNITIVDSRSDLDGLIFSLDVKKFNLQNFKVYKIEENDALLHYARDKRVSEIFYIPSTFKNIYGGRGEINITFPTNLPIVIDDLKKLELFRSGRFYEKRKMIPRTSARKSKYPLFSRYTHNWHSNNNDARQQRNMGGVLDGMYFIGLRSTIKQKISKNTQYSQKFFKQLNKINSSIICVPQIKNDYMIQDCKIQGTNKMFTITGFAEDTNHSITKQHWGSVDIITFVDWLLEIQKSFETLDLKYKDFLDVYVEDLGSSYGAYTLNHELKINSKYTKEFQKSTTAHEYFHHAELTTVNDQLYWSNSGDWLWEGMAYWFEDYFNDDLNLYKIDGIVPLPLLRVLELGISESTKNRGYDKFTFWKQLKNNCGFNPPLKLKNIFDGISDLTWAVKTLREELNNEGCHFGFPIGDNLASSFLFYNWATLGEKNGKGRLSELDYTEGNILNFVQLDQSSIFDDSSWTKTNPNLHHFRADIRPKNVYDAVIPPYGAKSFKILANTLPKLNKKRYSTDKLKLSIRTNESKISKNLKLVATSGNDKPTNKNSFVLMADESHLFTDKERGNDFFVTLTNTIMGQVNVIVS